MHYDTATNAHGMPFDPFKALVAPRPVGWISTVSTAGVPNLAPYSFFNAIADRPHYVMFSSGGFKDSVRNITETGEFVCSLATFDLRFEVNGSAAVVAPGVDEFALTGLTPAPSRFVKPPRVKESPAAIECRHWKTVELPESSNQRRYVVFGEVVGIYIDDAFIRDGRVDTGAMRPIARLGYKDYGVITPETMFSIDRPVVAADGTVTYPGQRVPAK